MKFRFIREHRQQYHLSRMLKVLNVSASGWHSWKKRPESPRSKENARLLVQIKAIHSQNRQVYGSPRMVKALREQGIFISQNRTARLMKHNGIKAKTFRRFRPTTNSNHAFPIAPNRLERNFAASKPNQVWVSDITYIWTQEGWLYLAVILDLYSRKVVGWSMQIQMSVGLVRDAWQMAVLSRRPGAGLIHHSDRGIQYACESYQTLLKESRALCSMSRKGNCWDNAPAESFFHSLKTEHVYQHDYQTREQAKRLIFEYLESFYNPKRLHSTLGYVSPEDFQANLS